MPHTCGRRYDTENWLRAQRGLPVMLVPQDEGPDTYEVRDPERVHPGSTGSGRRACSYCGSADPEDLLREIMAGTVELGPTDKGYKMYLKFADGGHHKFYTAHFSPEQSNQFHQLLVEGRLRIGFPGRFYAGIYLPGLKRAAPPQDSGHG